MKKGAVISECGLYRYSLTRIWDESKPTLGVVMLNPSTADADRDDMTITKLIGFAERLGYGGFIVGNLFAYRATDPKDLAAFIDSNGHMAAVGPKNDEYLNALLIGTKRLLKAWGVSGPKRAVKYRTGVLGRRMFFAKAFALGYTQGWDPVHPSRAPYSLVDSIKPEFRGDAS